MSRKDIRKMLHHENDATADVHLNGMQIKNKNAN